MFGGSLCRGGEMMAMTGALAILSVILVPNFIKARELNEFTECKRHLKELGTACEMWSVDHAGHYPERLDLLRTVKANGSERTYLPSPLTCPRTEQTYRFRLEPLADTKVEDYQITCPDGTAHGLPGDEPRYRGTEGLSAGTPSGHLGVSTAGLSLLGALLALGLFGASLARRPEPSPRVAVILDRYPALAWLSCASWFLLVSGTVWALMATTWSWPLTTIRLILSCWLSGLIVEGLVRLGYRGWDLLSPRAEGSDNSSHDPIGEQPCLRLAGRREVLVPSTQERRLASLISLLLPSLVLLTICLIAVFEPDPALAARSTLIGLALAAMVSFPMALWGKSWARSLTRRELEWVAGSGQLLEHRLDGTRTRVLGSLGDIESVAEVASGYEIVIGGERFLLRAGELGAGLATARPA